MNIRKKILWFGLLLVCEVSVLHPQQHKTDFPLTLKDVLGRTLILNEPPRRVVSLSPGITEILFAIGAGNQVVGITQYCNYPPEAQSRTKVGGFSGSTVNIEHIARLKPDMVLLSGFMHERLIPLLERLSIPVFALEPQNFEEVYRTIEDIGRLTGNLRSAGTVITGMQEKIRQAEARRGNRERPGVFWELSDEPLITAGGNTFISEAIYLAGGRNVFADLQEQWPTVNTEQVLLKSPVWIIAGDDHGKAIEPRSLARRPGWSKIPGVRDNRIALVNADWLYRYGPRLADAVMSIAEILWGKP
ncbi:MAG: cobalamin-binding protein [Treponema sp.]|jgi:iron complex transport system substrate-binding protein|nr:cobalamin-binding protein [Treponema sp.]